MHIGLTKTIGKDASGMDANESIAALWHFLVFIHILGFYRRQTTEFKRRILLWNKSSNV